MLNQNDLQAIRAIMQEEIAESEKRINDRIDTRIAETEKQINDKIDTRIAETEKRINDKIDTRIAETEKRINDKIDTKIAESENLLLEEMDRVQMFLESKINTVKGNLEELRQYYKITKLENDNTAILLKMIEELSRRIEELEKKSA